MTFSTTRAYIQRPLRHVFRAHSRRFDDVPVTSASALIAYVRRRDWQVDLGYRVEARQVQLRYRDALMAAFAPYHAGSCCSDATASARSAGCNRRQARTVSTTAMIPIAIVASPTAPCRPRLAQVSQRAETASGTAITIESAPMPIIEPIPNSAT